MTSVVLMHCLERLSNMPGKSICVEVRGSTRDSSFPFYPILKIPNKSTISSWFMSSAISDELTSNSAIPDCSDKQYGASSIFWAVQGIIAAY